MTSAEIRQSFLDFFRSKSHTIVPSSSLQPDSPNLLFTNAGMNQFVPIFLGQRPCPYDPRRAADTQKCIRAGGKHNDLEDVGLDTYHHTFFEMLGNWSFGDYFKADAIRWAWELLTDVWKFPKARLYATVYRPGPGEPSAFDQEAYDLWAELFAASGLDPKVHIAYGGKKDNFWMMGETGPCGPCSEVHVDLTPEGDTRGQLVNQGSPKCIEIWNLVFMQFNANPDGSFSPLPAQNVDTGMGFERVTAILQNTRNFTDFRRVMSNYETDVFRPLFSRLEQLSGQRYTSTLPTPGTNGANPQEQIDIAFRVIADHIRTLSFAIADGIAPGNTDRHYVLRRILRRAVRYGRTLGFHTPFFHQLVAVLAETLGEVFPEIRARQGHVEETIRLEEEAFNRTLDRGIELFENRWYSLTSDLVLQKTGGKGIQIRYKNFEDSDAEGVTRVLDLNQNAQPQLAELGIQYPPLSGKFAFELYDTYGFPFDLTELMARERGMVVDQASFERLMEEQRARARAAQKKEVISLSQIETTTPTQFVGYDALTAPATVLEVVGLKDRTAVILDVSPCYAEMGGQVGDAGILSHGDQQWRVTDTRKSGSTWLHYLGEPDTAGDAPWPAPGMQVALAVDTTRRAAIQRHHTVTHLLHWALHEVVSPDASQKGSFVGADKLTFDFNHAPLTAAQLADVERLVNERILENAPVTWMEVKYPHVKDRKDIMQFFGEKYGEWVRVVQIGGQATRLDGYSMELCGGTHCRATGEIGLFRVVGENAIAAGVRRIEALAGLEAWRRAHDELQLLRSVAQRLAAPVPDLEKKVEALLAQQRELENQLETAARRQAAETARQLVHRATPGPRGVPAIIENVGEATGDILQEMVNALKGRFEGVVVLAGVANGAVSLVASVASPFTSQIQAGRLLQQIAPVVGGKGGGRPDNARGGGKDATQLEAALALARQLV